MSDQEIERRWLLPVYPNHLDATEFVALSYGFYEDTEGGVVRITRALHDRPVSPVVRKTQRITKRGSGLTRTEIKEDISEEQCTRLLNFAPLQLDKSRAEFDLDGIALTVDQYDTGPLVAEIEFESEDQAVAFSPPLWFGPEVTDETGFNAIDAARNESDFASRVEKRIRQYLEEQARDASRYRTVLAMALNPLFLSLNANDLFGYACADSVNLTKVSDVTEVVDAFAAHGWHGVESWMSLRRQWPPIPPIAEALEQAGLPYFKAGDERTVMLPMNFEGAVQQALNLLESVRDSEGISGGLRHRAGTVVADLKQSAQEEGYHLT